jgi:hypothetical protein
MKALKYQIQNTRSSATLILQSVPKKKTLHECTKILKARINGMDHTKSAHRTHDSLNEITRRNGEPFMLMSSRLQEHYLSTALMTMFSHSAICWEVSRNATEKMHSD